MDAFSPIERIGLGPLPVLLLGLLLGLGFLLFLTRRGHLLAALRLTLSQPAFLVPPAMVTAALVLLGMNWRFTSAHENPFGIVGLQLGRGGVWCLLLLALVAAGLAGQIGLLQAQRAGHRPGSRWFLRGVVDHTLTLGLGKIAVAALLYWLSLLRFDGIGRVLVLVPSVLFAPLLGTTARHPRDPARALAACISIASKDLAAVGRVVTAQALFVFGTFALYDHFGHPWGLTPGLLAFSSSALSYNHFPLLLLFGGRLLDFVAIGLTVLASSVFVTAHFLGGSEGYDEVSASAPAAAAPPDR